MQGFEKESFFKENGITFSKPNSNFKAKKFKNRPTFGTLKDLHDNSEKFTLILGDSVTFE